MFPHHGVELSSKGSNGCNSHKATFFIDIEHCLIILQNLIHY